MVREKCCAARQWAGKRYKAQEEKKKEKKRRRKRSEQTGDDGLKRASFDALVCYVASSNVVVILRSEVLLPNGERIFNSRALSRNRKSAYFHSRAARRENGQAVLIFTSLIFKLAAEILTGCG